MLERALHGLAVDVKGPLVNSSVSIVTGMARGADMLAYLLAKEWGVVVYEFPADWGKHGKGAGFMRNQDMANFSDGLLAFWDTRSSGTKHMIQTMANQKKPTWVWNY